MEKGIEAKDGAYLANFISSAVTVFLPACFANLTAREAIASACGKGLRQKTAPTSPILYLLL